MSIIDPPAGWDDVDGINTNERLLGGPDGPLNRAAVALTARTKQLSEWRASDVAALGRIAYFFTPEMFSPPGFGQNETAAVQAAIDAAAARALALGGSQKVVLPRVYSVAPNPESLAVSGEYAAGRVCLNLRSGVSLCGPGGLQLITGVYGAQAGAIIGNWSGPIATVAICGVSIDGGRDAGTTGNIASINVLDTTDCTITDNRVSNSTGGGIYVRGTLGNGYCSRNAVVRYNRVTNSGYIGIQVERPQSPQIVGNWVTLTGDNGIDVFGDDSAGGQENAGIGIGITIIGNIVRQTGQSGLFLESVGRAVVEGNHFLDFATYGVFLNRINSASLGNVITGNIFRNSTQSGIGLNFKNNPGRTEVSTNRFENLLNSVRFERAQYVVMGQNTHALIASEIYQVAKGATFLWRSHFARQIYEQAFDATTGLPQISSPNDCPDNTPGRIVATTLGNLFSLSSQSENPPNYTKKTVTLQLFPSTSVYSRFGTDVAGETTVYLSGANEPVIGDLALIAGSSWQFVSRPATGVWVIRRFVTGAFTAGDYTATLNSGLTVVTKFSGWLTN